MTTVHFLGHATLTIDHAGQRLIIDPLLRDTIPLLRRVIEPVQPRTYQDPDAVLITHMHYDHLDLPSLRVLGTDRLIVCPLGSAVFLNRHGFPNTHELPVGESISLGAFRVQAAPAVHTLSRHPGGHSAQAIGYIVEGGGRIYHPGDTRFFPQMADLAGDLAAAFMPVWGWGPHRGKEHMSPRQAAEALALLQPRLAVPIHWGTLLPRGYGKYRPGFFTRPPHEFFHYAKKYAPQVKVRILAPGQSIEI
jgi:L-ascorbate metabolism protein UlaG (beta-lactamase superfamily)